MLSVAMSLSLRLMGNTNVPPTFVWNVPATSGFLKFSSQISVLTGLVFWSSSDELEWSSSSSRGHFLCLLQESSLYYGHCNS